MRIGWRRLAVGGIGGVVAIAALTALFRWMQGRDVLTGIDPVTSAATAHDDVEVGSLADSGAGVFAVARRGSPERAYFRLRPRLLFSMPAERLTAPIEWKDCGSVLPDWLPLFQPTSRKPLCISMRTDGDAASVARTALSLVVAKDRLPAAVRWYEGAFSRAGLEQTAAVAVDLSSPDLDAIPVLSGELDFASSDASRRAELSYFRGERWAEAIVIVQYPGTLTR